MILKGRDGMENHIDNFRLFLQEQNHLWSWSSSFASSSLDLTVATGLSDHSLIVALQGLSFTGMEHQILHTRAVNLAKGLVREVAGCGRG